jgi:hypothetical protein
VKEEEEEEAQHNSGSLSNYYIHLDWGRRGEERRGEGGTHL